MPIADKDLDRIRIRAQERDDRANAKSLVQLDEDGPVILSTRRKDILGNTTEGADGWWHILSRGILVAPASSAAVA